MAQLAPEFAKRHTKVIGVSVDSVQDHEKWKRDIEAFGGAPADFPIIDDSSLTVAKAYDMLEAEYYLPTEGRTPAHSSTVRTVYIIGPDKKIKLSMNLSDDRRPQLFAEILRALDAVQMTDGKPCHPGQLGGRAGRDVRCLENDQAKELRRSGHQAALSALCRKRRLADRLQSDLDEGDQRAPVVMLRLRLSGEPINAFALAGDRCGVHCPSDACDCVP